MGGKNGISPRPRSCQVNFNSKPDVVPVCIVCVQLNFLRYSCQGDSKHTNHVTQFERHEILDDWKCACVQKYRYDCSDCAQIHTLVERTASSLLHSLIEIVALKSQTMKIFMPFELIFSFICDSNVSIKHWKMVASNKE